MVRKFTQVKIKGKKVLKYSDFQLVVCELQALDPFYQEKVTEILQDSKEGRVYYITNSVLFFKDRVIMPV